MSNYFEIPTINEHFREELRKQVVNEFETSMRPTFSWKLIIPMATSLALMLFVIIKIVPDNSNDQRQAAISLESTDLAVSDTAVEAAPQTIEEIEQNLTEIESLLKNDEALNQAIKFDNL